MSGYIQTTFSAIKIVWQGKMYRILFFPTLVVFFSFFVAIPIVSIPSNTLQFQFSLYTLWDYSMLFILSALGSLFILMNIYTYRQLGRSKGRFDVIAKGSVGSIPGTLASIFGAASCPMCVASLFGFLGFGAVGFLVRYQWWIFSIALIFMLFSLHFASRKVNGVCAKCK